MPVQRSSPLTWSGLFGWIGYRMLQTVAVAEAICEDLAFDFVVEPVPQFVGRRPSCRAGRWRNGEIREEEVSSPTGRLHVLQWQCLRVQRLPSATDQVDVQPDLLVIGDVPDPGLREQPTRSGEGLLEDVYHLRTWHGAGARVLGSALSSHAGS